MCVLCVMYDTDQCHEHSNLLQCVCVFPYNTLCELLFDRTVLYMCIEYHIQVNMYHVSAQGVDERRINVHYYY